MFKSYGERRIGTKEMNLANNSRGGRITYERARSLLLPSHLVGGFFPQLIPLVYEVGALEDISPSIVSLGRPGLVFLTSLLPGPPPSWSNSQYEGSPAPAHLGGEGPLPPWFTL